MASIKRRTELRIIRVHLQRILPLTLFLGRDRAEQRLRHFVRFEGTIAPAVSRGQHLHLVAGLADEPSGFQLANVHTDRMAKELRLVEPELRSTQHVPAQ